MWRYRDISTDKDIGMDIGITQYVSSIIDNRY